MPGINLFLGKHVVLGGVARHIQGVCGTLWHTAFRCVAQDEHGVTDIKGFLSKHK